MRLILIPLLFCIFNTSSFSQFENYKSFDDLDRLSIKYVQANKLDSAVAAIEFAMKEFPEDDQKATYILNFLYSRTGQKEKSLDNWAYGLKKRYYYGLNNLQYRDQFKDNPRFKKLAEIDKQIGDSLNNLSHLIYEVKLPENYTHENKYPLLVVFHGNGRNLEKAEKEWTSTVLSEQFIVIYLQSYIYRDQYNFKWVVNDTKTDKEFKDIFEEVIKKYSINKNKIILSGMSAGGSLAIHYGFSQFVPASGLILNCPVVQDLPNSAMKEFVAKQRKIVIITGENDFGLNDQKKLIIQLDQNQARIKVIEGIGHQYPQNFSSLLDEYANWVIE